jgi:polyisoprenoid-binding protein YceI
MCAVGAVTYINHSRPQALGLASGTQRTPAPSPSPEDPLVAACAKPPASSAPAGSSFTGLWVVQPGSIAGYRAREKFFELTSPHDAVARTDRLAGWLVIAGSDAAPVLVAGCVAVDVTTLQSVDVLPGFDVRDRDKIARDFMGAHSHPFVVFQPNAVDLKLSGSTAAVQHVSLVGDIEISGVTMPATFKLDVRVRSGTVAVAGSTTVNAQKFGIQVPTEADGFVRVNPQIILEVSLVLLKP